MIPDGISSKAGGDMLNAQLSRLQTVFLIVLGLFFLMASVEAPIDRATLTGIVTDSSDAVIPNARIECAAESAGLRTRRRAIPRVCVSSLGQRHLRFAEDY